MRCLPVEDVYYHPSPMRKNGSGKIRGSRTLIAQRESDSTSREHNLPTPTTSSATAALSDSGIMSNVLFTILTDNHSGPKGLSRPSTIFAENQAGLGSGLWDVETEVSDHDYLHNKKVSSSHGTFEDVELGTKILLLIPSQSRCVERLKQAAKVRLRNCDSEDDVGNSVSFRLWRPSSVTALMS